MFIKTKQEILSGTTLNRKNNAFDLLRIILAFFVFVTHSYYLKKIPVDIVSITGSQTSLGEIGLIGFFSLSGFLITKSFFAKKDIVQFILNRLLRIYPGFWVCLFITALLVAPLIYLHDHSSLSGYQLTKSMSAYGYIKYNYTTYIRQPYITGVLDSSWIRNLNGSLWTLFSEILCYSIILILGITGILRRKYFFLFLVIFFQFVFVAICTNTLFSNFLAPLITYENAKLFMSFFIGSIIFLFEKNLIQKWLIPFVSMLLLLSFLLNFAVMFLPILIGILFINIFSSFKCDLPIDISYGFYIYAFPVQILVLTYFDKLNLFQYSTLSFLLIICVATISYLAVEKPALKLKAVFYKRIIFLLALLKNRVLRLKLSNSVEH